MHKSIPGSHRSKCTKVYSIYAADSSITIQSVLMTKENFPNTWKKKHNTATKTYTLLIQPYYYHEPGYTCPFSTKCNDNI